MPVLKQENVLVTICPDDNDRYRFGFNGQEKVNEWAGIGNFMSFEARGLDTRTGRWLSVDPLAVKYPSASPYNFVLNTPIWAKDPDGRLVIFVNGFRSGSYIEYAKQYFQPQMRVTGFSRPPWEMRGGPYSTTDKYGGGNGSYWGEIDDMFMNRINDHNAIYTDGGYSPHSTGSARYMRGYQDGIAIIKAVASGEIRVQRDANGNITEAVEIIGHSHGGWHAAGMADAINDLGGDIGLRITDLYMINPHQPNDANVEISGNYRSVQNSRPSDLLSSGNKLGGLGRKILRGILKDFGNSELKRVKGIDEYHEMKDVEAIKRLDGHFIEDAKELGDIPSGQNAAIEKRYDIDPATTKRIPQQNQ